MTDVTVTLFKGEAREETVALSQNAAQVLMGMTELWSLGLVSGDEDVTGHASYEDEVTVECPAAVTFKGRCVALALNEANNA